MQSEDSSGDRDVGRLPPSVEQLARAALHRAQPSLIGTFRACGAKTREDRALIVDHYYGQPPHSRVTPYRSVDGWRFRLTPTAPRPGCLACRRELDSDGTELLIRPASE